MHYRLQRSGDAPLAFDGEKIAEQRGRYAAGKEHNRWHDLAVYRFDDSRFVAALEYTTLWSGETDHSLAVVCDSGAEVAAVFRDYDPVACVSGFPIPQSADAPDPYRDRRERLHADVRRRYEQQIAELLDDDRFAESPAVGDAESPAAGYDRLRKARDLRRYRRLIEQGLAEVRALPLSQAEASLIMDSLNGWGFSLLGDEHDFEATMWPANVEDSIRLNRLDEKWLPKESAAELLDKIRRLSPLGLVAVAEAAERFWTDHTSGPQHKCRDTAECLRKVGLVP